MTRPRILILTAGGLNSRRVAEVLHRVGIDYEVVTMSHARRRSTGSAPSRLTTWLRDSVANIRSFREIRHRSRPRYPVPHTFGGRCNSSGLKRILESKSPDYILMMGGGIISEDLIRTARGGVLNAHPGLLPWVRGLDAIKHSVRNSVPVGVSGHFIDPGIDTGNVVCRYLLPISESDDFASIQHRSNELSCAIIVDLAQRLWKGEMLPRNPQKSRGTLYTRMSPDQEQDLATLSERAFEIYTEKKVEFAEIPDGAELLQAYRNAWGDRNPY